MKKPEYIDNRPTWRDYLAIGMLLMIFIGIFFLACFVPKNPDYKAPKTSPFDNHFIGYPMK
jgi:hypothetical protein